MVLYGERVVIAIGCMQVGIMQIAQVRQEIGEFGIFKKHISPRNASPVVNVGFPLALVLNKFDDRRGLGSLGGLGGSGQHTMGKETDTQEQPKRQNDTAHATVLTLKISKAKR